MEEVSEDDFNLIMDKLMLTLYRYENNFRELSFLKSEIEQINITQLTRLEFLEKINAWTYEVAPRSYVIRFIHHRLEEDINDASRGAYSGSKFPAYLEFGYNPDAD
jgi:hypothetical protein